MRAEEMERHGMDTGSRFDQLKQAGNTTRDAVVAVIEESIYTHEGLKEFKLALEVRGYMVTLTGPIFGSAAFSCTDEPIVAQDNAMLKEHGEALMDLMDRRISHKLTHDELLEAARSLKATPAESGHFTLSLQGLKR